MLDKEFTYYINHQSELLPLYENKYIIIVGENVVGAYDTAADALYNGDKKYQPGHYLIQLCTKGNGAYSVRPYSRIFC